MHTLSTLTLFPTLLSFGFGSYFIAPLFLRLCVAVAFGYQAVQHIKHKRAVAEELGGALRFLSLESAVWLTGVLILTEAALGLLLFVGAYTQLAALLAGLGLAKMAYLKKHFHAYAPLPRSTYLVLIVICFTLLFTGAGQYAIDLPL